MASSTAIGQVPTPVISGDKTYQPSSLHSPKHEFWKYGNREALISAAVVREAVTVTGPGNSLVPRPHPQLPIVALPMELWLSHTSTSNALDTLASFHGKL